MIKPALGMATLKNEVNFHNIQPAGKVTYEIETSTGVFSGIKSLTFDAAGTKAVEMDFSGLVVDDATTEY